MNECHTDEQAEEELIDVVEEGIELPFLKQAHILPNNLTYSESSSYWTRCWEWELTL